MKAEGCPSEVMRVLGWDLDTRRLLLILPHEKFLNWSKTVKHLADPRSKRCQFKQLESTVGKLIHASKGIPTSRFFLQRTRTYLNNIITNFGTENQVDTAASDDDSSTTSLDSVSTCSSTGSNTSESSRPRPKPWYRYPIPPYMKEDMSVWIELLERARRGVNFNLLTCRVPTNVLLADACPFGMGGYSIKSGLAWQIQLNPEVYEMAGIREDTNIDATLAENPNLKLSNNLFEFIAQVITIWFEFHNGDIGPLNSVLCMSDNSSAIGWMHKASFAVNQPLHRRVAAKLVRLTLEGNFVIHAEHVPGKKNLVADYLSRTFELSPTELTHRVHRLFPSQIPENFRVCQLPHEIVCWISSVVPQQQESSSAKWSPVMNPETGHGGDGTNISACYNLAPTPFWTRSKPFKSERPSSPPSSSASETAIGTDEQVTDCFVRQLLKKPLASWRRLSGVTTGRAPPTSRDATPSNLLSPRL